MEGRKKCFDLGKKLCAGTCPDIADPTCPGHVLEGGKSQQLLEMWGESHTSEFLVLTGFFPAPQGE